MMQVKEQFKALECEGFVYRQMTEQDVDQAAIIFAEAFQREPMVKATGMTVSEFMDFADGYCMHAAHTGMGLVVEEKITGDIIGMTILEDAINNDESEDLPEKLEPIFAMLDSLYLSYIDDAQLYITGEVCVYSVSGIKKGYAGKGIGILLAGQAVELGRSHGYSTMIVAVTGRISQCIMGEKHGFTTHKSIWYQDFEFNGEKVFRNIPDKDLDCMLMESHL